MLVHQIWWQVVFRKGKKKPEAIRITGYHHQSRESKACDYYRKLYSPPAIAVVALKHALCYIRSEALKPYVGVDSSSWTWLETLDPSSVREHTTSSQNKFMHNLTHYRWHCRHVAQCKDRSWPRNLQRVGQRLNGPSSHTHLSLIRIVSIDNTVSEEVTWVWLKDM